MSKVKGLEQAVKDFNNNGENNIAFIIIDVKEKIVWTDTYSNGADIIVYEDAHIMPLFAKHENEEKIFDKNHEEILKKLAVEAISKFENHGELLSDQRIIEAFKAI